MSRRGLLSDAEMEALLGDGDEGGEGDGSAFDDSLLFTPGDFADFCELVAPVLLSSFERLAPLVDSAVALREPQLALVAPDAVRSDREIRHLFVPLNLARTRPDGSPDCLLEIPGPLARRLAVLMIGGGDDDGEDVDDAHLSSLAELVRQYRLQLAKQSVGPGDEPSTGTRRTAFRPVISGKKNAAKMLKRLFTGQDHLVALTAACSLDDGAAGSVRFVFPVAVTTALLSERRNPSLAAPPEAAPPDELPSPVDATDAPSMSPTALKVVARLGTVALSKAAVTGLAPGAVVKLDSPAGDEVDLVIDDVVVARGEVVVEDDHYAVRVRVLNRSAVADRKE